MQSLNAVTVMGIVKSLQTSGFVVECKHQRPYSQKVDIGSYFISTGRSEPPLQVGNLVTVVGQLARQEQAGATKVELPRCYILGKSLVRLAATPVLDLHFNQVALGGAVMEEPEVRQVSPKATVTVLQLGVRFGESKGGEWCEKWAYLPVAIWGPLGKVAQKYLNRKKALLLTGWLQAVPSNNQVNEEMAIGSEFQVIADCLRF